MHTDAYQRTKLHIRFNTKHLPFFLHSRALRCGRVQHRILHQPCTGFCTACRAIEMFIRDLQVVLPGNRDAITNPSRHHMLREILNQFSFTR